MSNTDKRIRVLVVDDSAFMRKVMLGLIAGDPQMEVIGEARDGREAVTLAKSLRPDVISMDLNMPHLDGLGATEIIMSQNPRPILIVSSESKQGAESTLRALELGAIDFVTKPTGGIDLNMNAVQAELMRKLKMAAKVRVVRTATRSKRAGSFAGERPLEGPGLCPASQSLHISAGQSRSASRFPIVVLAASTGGPATLMRLVPGFRKDMPAALLLALHMPANFTAPFADQLTENTSLRVKSAESGEECRPGTLYVCPGSHHMRLDQNGRIELLDGLRISGYRPCADITMEAAASYAGPMSIGVVFTGMGNDASRGVRAIKAAGGYVIAQDEASSVIFGMPSEAIKTGAVDEVLGIDTIASAIQKRVSYLLGAMHTGAM